MAHVLFKLLTRNCSHSKLSQDQLACVSELSIYSCDQSQYMCAAVEDVLCKPSRMT